MTIGKIPGSARMYHSIVWECSYILSAWNVAFYWRERERGRKREEEREREEEKVGKEIETKKDKE